MTAAPSVYARVRDLEARREAIYRRCDSQLRERGQLHDDGSCLLRDLEALPDYAETSEELGRLTDALAPLEAQLRARGRHALRDPARRAVLFALMEGFATQLFSGDAVFEAHTTMGRLDACLDELGLNARVGSYGTVHVRTTGDAPPPLASLASFRAEVEASRQKWRLTPGHPRIIVGPAQGTAGLSE